jgi:FdhE protein
LSAHVEEDRWQRRAIRARRLAGERPAVAETLRFYANLAELQETLLRRYPRPIATSSLAFAERLDRDAAVGALPELLAFLERAAPAAVAREAEMRGDEALDRWRDWIQTLWTTGGREAADANSIQRFILEALLAPFAEMVSATSPPARPSPPAHCPLCTGIPFVALLREQGHGAKRSVVCGFCFSEWPSPRLECLHCGEATFESLPVFRSDEVDSVRIDACESCKTYIKTIDLTRDGEASPIVDDIASMTLDIWAREHGYRRLRANLFGF